eukprot:6199405-Pleurochrysis_carterae.AAC.2
MDIACRQSLDMWHWSWDGDPKGACDLEKERCSAEEQLAQARHVCRWCMRRKRRWGRGPFPTLAAAPAPCRSFHHHVAA